MNSSQDRVEEIEELFEQNDSDGNGNIDFDEFTSLMRDLDDDIPAHSLEIGFREIDVNKDGRINFAEFEFVLGVDAPVRISGDLANTPGITIEGPRGRFTLPSGDLRAPSYPHERRGCAPAGHQRL